MESTSVSSTSKDLKGALWFEEPGVVYFISASSECEGCKSIKIGVTGREGLLRRLRGIQSANHTKIRLLRVIEFAKMSDAEKKEGTLHKRFAEEARLQDRSVGCEWFRATDRLMKAIEEEGILPDEMVARPKCLTAVVKLFT